jgi:hypothetical protein
MFLAFGNMLLRMFFSVLGNAAVASFRVNTFEEFGSPHISIHHL